MELKDLLNNFFNKTNEIIDLLEKCDENFLEKLDILLSERQAIIEEINFIEYTNIEFENLSEELKLQDQDSQLSKLLTNKKLSIMKEIREVREEKSKLINGKKVNGKYINVNSVGAVFVSKKY